jgi:hypothetical protein
MGIARSTFYDEPTGKETRQRAIFISARQPAISDG